MKKLPIYLSAFLIVLTCNLANGQKRAISEVFQQISEHVSDSNAVAALPYFDQTDQKFYSTTKEYLENLTKNDSLLYTLDVHDIQQEKKNATAVVLETVRFSKYGRTTTNIAFKTYELTLLGKQWLIKSVEERTYLNANYATISSNFEPSANSMTGTAKIEFEILENGENSVLFWLNRGLSIDKIENEAGESLDFIRKDLSVEIPWTKPLSKGETIHLKFNYSGTFFNEFKELGYSLVNIGEEGVFANFVTEWYPKLNGTLTKAKAHLEYTVPQDLIVASVGKLINTTSKDGRTTFTYKVNNPMDYTFNANVFDYYSKDVNGMQINVYFINGSKEKAKMYADRTAEMIEYLADFYGALPCDSYTISEVPAEITMGLGGSGGQGLNFYPTNRLRDDTFEFPLIAHEMGHMWWGSLVNADIYSGALIAEGMSQVNAILCYRYFYGEDAMWKFINEGGELYSQSARSYFMQFNEEKDLPVAVYDESRALDLNRLAYLKPHIIMGMLMETIGFPAFEKGIKRIIAEYAHKRLGMDGIKKIMEAESGQNLDYFFDQWFYRAGAPEFSLAYTVKSASEGRYQVSGTIQQLRDIFKVKAEILMANDGKSEIRKISIDSAEQTFSFLIDFKPTAVVFDPDKKILRWTDESKTLSLFGEGMVLYFGGKNEEAIQKLTEFVKANPTDLSGHSLLGGALLAEKKYEEAKEHLQYTVDEYEKNGIISFAIPYTYIFMGRLYDETNNSELANQYYTRVLEMINVDGSHQKAKAYFEKKRGMQ